MSSILSTSGKLIYSGNEATLSAAISNAISAGISLRYADLSKSDLSIANLSYADLSGANLSWANLSGANLSRSNLLGANLIGADLSEANLRKSDLSEAILDGANFENSTGLYIPGVARSMQLRYTIVLVEDTLYIGYRHHKLHEWFAFSEKTINKMDSVALKWWRENKEMLYVWSEAAKLGLKLYSKEI
jgi:hypothetical protein